MAEQKVAQKRTPGTNENENNNSIRTTHVSSNVDTSLGNLINDSSYFLDHKKTSQELRMLSRSLSDCKSLLLNVMIQVSQFARNNQLCH